MWSLGLVGRGGELVFNLGSYKALYMDGGDGCVTRKNRTLQSFVHVTELVHVKVEYIMCISPQKCTQTPSPISGTYLHYICGDVYPKNAFVIYSKFKCSRYMPSNDYLPEIPIY